MNAALQIDTPKRKPLRLVSRDLSDIASNIDHAWDEVPHSARVHLDAMYSLKSVEDETAEAIIRGFLANATDFKGEAAKSIKSELKTILKSV